MSRLIRKKKKKNRRIFISPIAKTITIQT